MENPKYRFLDQDKEHQHQIFDEEILDYKNLTGTTTIVDVLGKPFTWWASGKACEVMGWLKADKEKRAPYRILNGKARLEQAGQRLAEIKELDAPKYLDLLDTAYKAHSVRLEDSAKEGTDLHAELERVVNLMMNGFQATSDNPKVRDFIAWADKYVERFLWSELHCYSEPMYVGGICDFGALMKDGSIVLGDFKSHKEGYFSDFIQCGGYDLQITENGGFTAEGEKIFTLDKPIEKYVIFPFGAEKLKPCWCPIKVGDIKEAFLSALSLYRIKGKFDRI